MKNPFLNKEVIQFGSSRTPNSDIVKVLPTETKRVWNSLDDFGASVGLTRLENESNSEFNSRILFKVNNKFNSTKAGLYNILPNELGLNPTAILEIECTNDTFESFDIQISSLWIKIYSQFQSNDNFTLIAEIPLIHQDYLTIKQVSDAINTLDDFTCTILNASFEYLPANMLMPIGAQVISKTTIKSGTKLAELADINIVPGSLVFSNNTIFLEEVESLATLSKAGDYFVSYIDGIIVSYDITNTDITATYRYLENPLRVLVACLNLNSLEDILQYDIFYSENIPTDYIQNIISAVNNNIHQSWAP